MTAQAFPDAQAEQREEAEWASRTRAGDREAARLLCERFYPRIVAFVRRRVSASEDVKDICQSAVLAWLRSIRAGRLQDESRPGAYLFGICHKLAARRPPRDEPADDLERYAAASNPEAEADARLAVRRVLGAAARLSTEDQTVLRARLVEGLSHDECATRLGISPAAARKRYERALGNLRARLGEA